MKRYLIGLAAAFMVIVTTGSFASAADVALTSVGQSPDAMMVKVVLKSLSVKPDYDPLMKADDLSGHKVIIAVVGGSSKGLGAAGIDKDQEVSRAEALLDKAKADGVKVLVMHVGGPGRRGTLSDLFISAAVPYSDGLILVDGADQDGLFESLLGDKPVEPEVVPNVRGTKAPLEKILASWEVL